MAWWAWWLSGVWAGSLDIVQVVVLSGPVSQPQAAEAVMARWPEVIRCFAGLEGWGLSASFEVGPRGAPQQLQVRERPSSSAVKGCVEGELSKLRLPASAAGAVVAVQAGAPPTISSILNTDAPLPPSLAQRATPTSNVTLRVVQASGPDRGQTEAILKRYTNQLRYCYERSLVQSPESSGGEASFRYFVAPSGAVTNVETRASTFLQPEVTDCMKTRFYRMMFPSEHPGLVEVTVVATPG